MIKMEAMQFCIYDYDSESDSWTQFGGDIDGDMENDHSGESVTLSSDGSTVAIGAYDNDGTSGIGNPESGYVRLYSLIGETYQFVWNVDSGEALSDGDYHSNRFRS